MNGQGRETIVDQGRKVGAINLEAEIAMMIITGKEAVNVRGIVTVIETVIESVIENENIVIVKRWADLFLDYEFINLEIM